MGNVVGGITKVTKAVDDMETTLLTSGRKEGMGSYPPPPMETSSPLVLALTSPIDDFNHLLCEAIATCEKYERTDIILTYLCNHLHAIPKEVDEISSGLKHIIHLQDNITSTFVPIRY